MNKERLLAVADAIENETLPNMTFDMSTYGHRTDCGTAACIAGHALALYDPEFYDLMIKRGIFSGEIVRRAREILDLSANAAYVLFNGNFSENTTAGITREEAVAAIRRLAETGVIKTYYGGKVTAGTAKRKETTTDTKLVETGKI